MSADMWNTCASLHAATPWSADKTYDEDTATLWPWPPSPASMPASQASAVGAGDAAAPSVARRLSPSPPPQHLLGDDALWPQDKSNCQQQGRIPWIVGGDPATGLAHPLSHPYPGASHYPPPGHHPAYPLLPVMPPQPGQAADTWGAIGIGLPAQHQHPGHPGQALPPSTGAVTATNDAVSGAAPYKLDPDAMQAAVASAAATASMYYPAHQAASSAGGACEVSSDASGTTATASDSLANFQSIQALEPQDMMQTLNQYFEEGAPWMDPGHQAAALAAAHHHPHIHQHSHQHQHNPVLDGYPPEYGLIRPSYHDRKKKLIKEWSKSSTNGSASPSVAVTPTTSALAMAESMARSAISGGYATDFLYNPTSYLKEEVGPLRGAADYPYAYAAAYQEAATAAAGLVHPYTHHMAVAAGSSRVGDLGGLVGGGGGRSRDRKRKNASASASSVDGAGGGPIVGGHQGLTRDERKALTLSLPIAVQEIINLPMDEFNDLLSKHDLTEEQLTLCRDIRRRGKNKVAARNCRKRKIDQIKQLEDDVVRIRHRKTELINEHEKLVGQRGHWSDVLKRLHDYILKELGQDPNHFQLQMDHNRQVHVLPRSHADELDPSKLPRPYHYAPSIGPPIMEQTHTAR